MGRFLLVLFLGWTGIHKFMDGKKGMGILYLCTMGLLGIGWTIDIFLSLLPLLKPGQLIISEPKITGTSNCKSVCAIKNLNKTTLYNLQQLVFPGSRNGIYSAEQILDACDTLISQNKHIIDDCKELIDTTENPDVFFSRYDLLIEKYEELSKYEPFVVIYGYQPIESLVYYRDSRSNFEKKFITRCYNKALVKSDSMKTEKGKKNQFIKMYDTLLSYESNMSLESFSFLQQKFEPKIN